MAKRKNKKNKKDNALIGFSPSETFKPKKEKKPKQLKQKEHPKFASDNNIGIYGNFCIFTDEFGHPWVFDIETGNAAPVQFIDKLPKAGV